MKDKKPYFTLIGANEDTKNVFEKAFRGGDYELQVYVDCALFVENLTKRTHDLPEGIFLSAALGEKNIQKFSEWLSRTTFESSRVTPGLFLMTSGDTVPIPFSEGHVDDCLLLPLRPLDLLSKVRHALLIKEWRQAQGMAHYLDDVEQGLKSHYKLASGLQKKLIPTKFKVGSGIKVNAKYLVGLRSGGDYYDVFEFDGSKNLGIFMADCSGYKLSSALMMVLLRLEIQKLKSAEEQTPARIVKEIIKQIKPNMRQVDHISLFFGILDRKDFSLKYVSFGNIHSICMRRKRAGEKSIVWEKTEKISSLKPVLSQTELSNIQEQSFKVRPLDRLVIASDGLSDFLSPHTNLLIEKLSEAQEKQNQSNIVQGLLQEIMDSRKISRKIFDDICVTNADANSRELSNELFFTLKDVNGKISPKSDSMPGEDSSLLILDISDRILRLAR